MNPEEMSPADLSTDAESALEQAAASLREILGAVASRLRPFPAFLGMATIQAVELEPSIQTTQSGQNRQGGADRGCVVVTPGGEIRELDITAIPGIAGVIDVDQVEEFREIEFPAEEYLVYAAAAIRQLSEELNRRTR